MPDDVVIEAERAEDADAIRAVVAAAFAHHPEVADLVEAIRASDRYRPDLSLVARHDAEVVGHVMLSGVDLVDGDRRCRVVSLSPLSVAPAHQRRGIGARLVHEAVTRADAAGEPLVVLEGSPRYYGRLGFEWSVPYGVTIDLARWAPKEAAQIRRLAAYRPEVRGHLDYPAAFAPTLTDR